MLPRLLLTLAAASALTLPPDCGVATWRAGPSLVRVELDRGGKLNALTRGMWEAAATERLGATYRCVMFQ